MKKFRKIGWFLLTAVFVSGLTGCMSIGALNPGEEVVIGRTSFLSGSDADSTVFQEYKISSGDVLDVFYQVESWKEQASFKIAVDHVLTVKFVNHAELSQTQTVRPDGEISLAFVGSIKAAGRTVDELTAELKEKYRDHLKDTDIYVVLEDFRGSIRELKDDLKSTSGGQSRLVTVRPDGFATFAMIGEISVAGRSLRDVKEELNREYSKIMPGLSAEIFLEQYAASQIYVLGQVNEPGTYQVRRPTSVFEAIAMAGSITTAARLDSVIVFRQKDDSLVATRLDLKRLMTPDRGKVVVSDPESGGGGAEMQRQSSASMFYLHPDDIVFVSRRRLNTAAEISREVADLLFFRGWSVSVN
jgi:polysaccharide export outer membrane protein